MKTRILTAVLSSTLMLAGAARLGAQVSSSSTGDDSSRLYSLNLVGQAYRDTAERERTFRESLTAAHFDVNHDGKLDATEQAAWEKRIRGVLETNPKFMKQFDRNHDNVLSDGEWDAAYAEIFEAKSAPAGNQK